MKSTKKRSVAVFAGGGTGGHVYPALAVVGELLKKEPDTRIVFVGSKAGLENKIVPKAGFELLTLPVGGLLRTGRLQQLKTLALMPYCLLISAVWILRLQPQFVLGVGGFAAGPFVLVSALLGRRTYIWEPNATPGLTNRILSRFVSTAFVVFESAKQRLRSKTVISAGLPIRPEIQYRPRESSGRLRVLVFGGSQGARVINQTVQKTLQQYPELASQLEVWHQTGSLDHASVLKGYEGLSVKCVPFIEDMATALNWADLVIARAGVGSVSEIIASRKASILIPLPTAAENHQEANARFLLERGGGEMILQRDLSPELLRDRLLDYHRNPQKIRAVEEALIPLQRPNGAVQISQILLEKAES